MKAFKYISITALAFMGLISCQKAPELTITSPASIELNVDGSSGSITFTANRDWSVSTSDSWISVSPSSGKASDGPVTVTVRCNANTTYDDRTATVTIRMEELSETVTVKQPANLGVVLPKQVFDLQSDTKSIDVEVQANVQYTVSTSVNWIKQTGTKGLASKTLTFSIEENKTYDSREGKITIKPQEGNAQEQVISVRQAQKDALIVEKTSYEMPYGGGEVEVKVESNVSFDVTPNVDWIHYVQTKALSGSTVCLKIDENETYSSRQGTVEIKQQNGSLKHTITVNQAGRIAVSSVTLDKTSLKLKEGESETLVATVKPDNATDKTVTWNTSDSSVATVNNGKVTAVKEGTATITARVGEKSASCKVTVSKNVISVTSVNLDKTSASLKVGETVMLTATVKPDDASDKTVTWSTSDASVATVSNGVVTAKKVGTATITASAGGKNATCAITVEATPVTSVTLDKPSATLKVGETVTLTATVKPDDATDKTVTWSTSDASVATVSNGVVTAKKIGTATITASAGGKNATCAITVEATPVTSVTLDKPSATLKVGETVTLTATVKPDDASDKTVTWSTSDASVATVDNGKVTAVKEGTATITARVGEKSASCKVTVSKNVISVTSVNLDKTSASLKVGETVMLTATVKPDDASDKTVTWSTSDASVATVSNGVVTAKKVGTATITASAGGKNATCAITVEATPVTSVTLDKPSATLKVGETVTLTATVKPDDATDKTVTWSTSDASVATVSNGVVSAKKIGTATITASAGGKSATCAISVATSGSHEGIIEEEW